MGATQRVKDLLDLPEQIRKGDFVLKLGEGLERVEHTVATYVVTPALAEAFDRSLSLVGAALRDGRSMAAYLHGSFGSGKSHFMALLSLMLDANEVVWRVPELHPLRDEKRHGFIGDKKLLQLHFHMVGAHSIEEAIFRRYVDYMRELHPEATVPGLFGDEQLFVDATRLLDELGDEKFFAPMNEGASIAGWGDLKNAAVWDRKKFDGAKASDEPGEREKLFSALVKTRFGSYASESRSFIDLDTGLARLCQHAADLGYDGVVLFLDELILWLAHRASDSAWLHNEVQKMVKLVEAQESTRAIPLVSFIARQRDLVSMVGEEYAGAENLRLRDSLKWWEGRYDTITLEDRNLPAIVERRVRKPKDAAAEKALGEAFDKLKRSAGPSWDTLLGREDAAAFKKLYPFSPALVEALVTLSGFLQRERTAIKLLMEILVEHIENLAPGQVVGVGDLFDVLAGGDESDDPIMRNRFEAAKQLYRYQLLPVIQQSNGTIDESRCQRMKSDHLTRIGCSNCSEKACSSDNALVKTLIIAALVPNVPALKDLTVSRLVHLNHGVLKVPIPGTEASLAAQKLKTWAAVVGQLRVGEGTDPQVKVMLEGVDLKPILDQARGYDTDGARQRVLRDLLFDSLGITKIADGGKDHPIDWRNTRRLGHIRFGNVRNFSDAELHCPEEHDWRLVVDFPFDQAGKGPHDDEERLDRYVADGVGSWTLVWLPSFFSKAINDMLGELVILEHILENDVSLRNYLAHLSIENQSRAKLDLDSLRSQKRARLSQVLEQAYGLAQPREGDLDTSHTVDNHLRVLKPGARIEPKLAANLVDAVDAYIAALLEQRYPRHPNFSHKLTKQRVDRLVRHFGDILDSDDKWIAADRADHEEMRGTLGVLGLVQTPEGRVRLKEDGVLQQLENSRRKHGVDHPTAGQVRQWLDENNKMGLLPEAADLAVRCYARATKRTFVRYDKPYEVQAGQSIAGDVVLEQPKLPEQAAWAKALEMAGSVFGIALAGKALHADNLKRFEARLSQALADKAGPCTALPGLLRRRADELGIDAQADRIRTAASAESLCALLQGQPVVQQVDVLASFVAETSPSALGRSVGAAGAAAKQLGDALVFGIFQQLGARQGELAGAEELLDKVRQALRQDEIHLALADRVRTLAEEGQRLLSVRDAPVTDPGLTTVFQDKLDARGSQAIVAKLHALLAEVEKHADVVDLELSGRITLRGRK